ncbi:MAG TPA: helix-turn-helix domain-containing protein, partial [Candidatus Baltobacteraceae bacterium]|nr:helix-turn-helix domain-containing protein [Candidatus Baltobacteraceae bacterium]
FTQVPNWLIDDQELGVTDKMTLVCLHRFAYGKRRIYPSQKTIAERVGVNRETVRFALQRLVERNLILPIAEAGKGRRQTYELCAPLDHPMTDNPPSDGGESAINNTDTELDSKNSDPVLLGSSCREEQNSGPVGIPSPGSPEFIGAAEAAARELGLPYRCPDDPLDAYQDIIERVCIVCNGEFFNAGSLDGLIDQFGVVRCWSQAMALEQRLASATKPIRNVTAYYMECVRRNAGPVLSAHYGDDADELPF